MEAAKLFDDIMQNGFKDEKLIEAKRLKHKSNDIAKETLTLLNATFITPIDGEDIQQVACLLNKISKKIVKARVSLGVYRLTNHTDNMKDQGKPLVKAAEELNYIISHLKKVTELKKEITESHRHEWREIESHGDEILYKAMDELFSGQEIMTR
ncbi:MAG: hypothetical protein MZU91_05595 [Desulfosudis oleivorans]|nr:hypothetical protein [Desulfosudis oleivorans]